MGRVAWRRGVRRVRVGGRGSCFLFFSIFYGFFFLFGWGRGDVLVAVLGSTLGNWTLKKGERKLLC